MKAIKSATSPTSVHELRSFLKTLNFYAKFLPNLAALLRPLYDFIKKGAEWLWLKECEECVRKAKELLCSADVFTLYSPRKPIRLTHDGSNYDVRAVLAHEVSKAVYRPVECASTTLTAAEQNCSQVKKEALAIVLAVKRFHTYLCGRSTTL